MDSAFNTEKPEVLENQIMDPNVPKSEREWWAHHKILELMGNSPAPELTTNLDRFDLEAQITDAWNTADDIDTISAGIIDHPTDWDVDRISNGLHGLSILHAAKCAKLFETFEMLVMSGDIK